MDVSPYAGDGAAWDAFVRRTPGGTFFHLIGWKRVLEQTYGFRSHYWLARRAGEVVGVLPLFEVHAPFMDRCLLSTPFAVEAGVCAVDAEARAALDAAALAVASATRAGYLELRDGCDTPGFRLREGLYFRFRRALGADDAADLAATPAKRRYMIRLGQRHGLRIRIDPGDLATVHHLFAHTARRFGTPVIPFRHFRALQAAFPDDSAVVTVHHEHQPVAGALLLFFGDTVVPYYVGSRRDAFRWAVNDFLYWELMRYARERGARVFDFGRSKVGTGAFLYKRLWGFEPEPLRYRVWTRSANAVPGRSSADPGVQWLQRLWRRLPLSLTKLLGPPIVARYGPYFT